MILRNGFHASALALAIAAGGLTALATGGARAEDVPSAKQQYEMLRQAMQRIEQLENKQSALQRRAQRAEAEAQQAKAELKKTISELASARNGGEAGPAYTDASATPTHGNLPVYAPTAKPAANGPAPDGWSVSATGEWLYWSPRQNELDFAVPRGPAPSSIGPVSSIDPDYDSGFRVGGAGRLGPNGLSLVYTGLDTSDSDLVTERNRDLAGTLILDDFTALTQGNIALASADWDLDYDAVDLNASHDLVDTGRVRVAMVGGVKWASIDENFQALYAEDQNLAVSDMDRATQETRMDAWGVNVGLDGRAELLPRLAATGSFIYSPMVGGFDQRFVYETSTAGLAGLQQVVNLADERTQMVSVFDVKLGLEALLVDMPDVQATLNFGYQFQHWANYPGLLKHTSESGEITFDHNDSSIGFDGFFLGGTVRH